MTVSKTEVVVPVLVAAAASLLVAKFRPFGKEVVWLKRGCTVGGLTLSTFFITRAFREKPQKPPELPKQPKKKNLPNPFEAKLIDQEVRTVAKGLCDLEIDEDKLRAVGDVVLALRATPKLKKSRRRGFLDQKVGPLFCLPDDLFGSEQAGRTYMGWIEELRQTKPSKKEDLSFVALVDKVVYGLSLALWKVYSNEEKQKIIEWENALEAERKELWEDVSKLNPMLPQVEFPPISEEGKRIIKELEPYREVREGIGGLGYGLSPVKRVLKTPMGKKAALLSSKRADGRLRGVVGPMRDHAATAIQLGTPDGRVRGQSSPTKLDPLRAMQRERAVRKFSYYYQLLPEAMDCVQGIAEATRPFARESLRHSFEAVRTALPSDETEGQLRSLSPEPMKNRTAVEKRMDALKKKISPLLKVRLPLTAGLTPHGGDMRCAPLELLQQHITQLAEVNKKTVEANNWKTLQAWVPRWEKLVQELQMLTKIGLAVIKQLDDAEGKL